VNNGSLGSYGYDGNSKRVKKTESGTTTYYVISSVLGSVMEVTSAGVQRAYVMSGGAVVAQLNPNGNFYWIHLDHLSSGRKMTDTSGNMVYRAEFDPYGKLLYEWSSPTNLNTKKFTGYERDAATNLDYAQARMYSSDWGRFLSPDPIGMRAVRPNSPKSLNRYSYVENDPINKVDPTGTFYSCWSEILTDYWVNFCTGENVDIVFKKNIFRGAPAPPRAND
jgi:RHS repeat-associated protein